MATKSIGYPEDGYKLIRELRDKLRKERGSNVSLADASTEATKFFLDKIKFEEAKKLT